MMQTLSRVLKPLDQAITTQAKLVPAPLFFAPVVCSTRTPAPTKRLKNNAKISFISELAAPPPQMRIYLADCIKTKVNKS